MPQDIEHHTAQVGDINMHYAACGSPDNPAIVFLHGFPEYSGAWAHILPAFSGTHYAIAPDQRGFGLTSKPEGLAAYQTANMVGDLVGLMAQISPNRPFILVGHDWGASVAYAAAMFFADRVSQLVIMNGVHPAPFQAALLSDPGQIAASQYFHFLRDKRAEEILSANDCEKLFGFLGHFSDTKWLSDDHKAGYLEAWTQPGAMTGMLNWYRATPIMVPPEGADWSDRENPFDDPQKFRVRMPHLLLWGNRDVALLPVSRQGLERFCDDLTMVETDDADHWIAHQQPDWVISQMRAFLGL